MHSYICCSDTTFWFFLITDTVLLILIKPCFRSSNVTILATYTPITALLKPISYQTINSRMYIILFWMSGCQISGQIRSHPDRDKDLFFNSNCSSGFYKINSKRLIKYLFYIFIGFITFYKHFEYYSVKTFR